MTDNILTYLSNLEQNNNREWFHAHKAEYQDAVAQFEGLIEGLMLELGKDDSRILQFKPGELTFKIMRDTRFSHDKSPYNPAFRCHISPGGKLPVPVGDFLFISPGGRSFLGGGLFADMFKDATKMVRDYISTHTEEFEGILEEPQFKESFKVEGSSLKNVPKGYDPGNPMADYLKFKSWYIEDHFEDALLDDTDAFIEYAVKRFRMMRPFNQYLNEALKGFQMPVR